MVHILPRLQVAYPAEPKIFLWDNLKTHYFDAVANEIYLAGHSIIPRPAYYPEDGPIEYVFNALENGIVRRLHEICVEDDLIHAIHQTIAEITNTDMFFIHCGY